MTAVGTMTGRFAAMTLALESLVVFFATLVASRLSTLDPPSCGSAVRPSLWCACWRPRQPVAAGGLVVGSAVQVLVLGTGVFVPAMFGLGAVFAAMWVWLLMVGRRIDRDRAAWESSPAQARVGRWGSGPARARGWVTRRSGRTLPSWLSPL